MFERPVELHRDAGIAHVRLNALPRNETNTAFFESLARCVNDIEGSGDVRGVLVYGAGRHFSSGADIEELRRFIRDCGDRAQQTLAHNVASYHRLHRLHAPVVALVNGCCFGSGCELALACHYRIASPHAVFALPESTFRLMPGCGGTLYLPAIVGLPCAVDLILSGKMLDAEEARACGLADALVARNRMIESGVALIRRLGGA